MRKFVLVVATSLCMAGGVGSTAPTKASGIKKLKPGVSLMEFVETFMKETLGDRQYALTERDDSIFCVIESQDRLFTMSWHFCVYTDDDIMTAVSHLTKDELVRDLPNILPINKQ